MLFRSDGYDARRAKKARPALADRWIRSRLAATIRAVREAVRRYRFNDAASAIYQFTWHELCDWYLETAKLPLYRAASPEERLAAQHTLVAVLETTLRLLHPFMPFITEEIWQRLPGAGESIMIAPYPRVGRGQVDAAAEGDMAAVMGAVMAIRNIRGEMRIAPGAPLSVTIRPAAGAVPLFVTTTALIGSLARAEVSVDAGATRPPSSALAVLGAAELYVDLAGVVDLAAERARLDKEIRKATESITFIEGKLARADFVERAPAAIVDKERQRLREHQELQQKLEASLAWIH